MSMCVFVCVRVGGGGGVHMCYVCVLAASVICQGILAPADEEIKSESPPVVTSCPSTPGVILTSLSYWLLVILICFFCVCPTVCLQCRHSLHLCSSSPRPLSVSFSLLLYPWFSFTNGVRHFNASIVDCLGVSDIQFHLLPSRLQMCSFKGMFCN